MLPPLVSSGSDTTPDTSRSPSPLHIRSALPSRPAKRQRVQPPQVGDLFKVHWTADDKWYVCRVHIVDESDKVSVRYFADGMTECYTPVVGQESSLWYYDDESGRTTCKVVRLASRNCTCGCPLTSICTCVTCKSSRTEPIVVRNCDCNALKCGLTVNNGGYDLETECGFYFECPLRDVRDCGKDYNPEHVCTGWPKK